MGKKVKEAREAPRPKESKPELPPPAARKAPRPKEPRPKQKASGRKQSEEKSSE